VSAAAPRQELADLRGEVLSHFDRAPVLSYGLASLAAAWGQMALLIALLQVRPEGPLWAALFFAAMGWTQYRQYFVLHEACHQALLPGAAANRWVGRITAALLFTSYRSFTAVHMEHHRLWGKREDPGAVDYFLRFRTRGEALWFFLRPLLGLSVLEKIWTNVARPLLRGRSGEVRPGEASIEPVDMVCVAVVQGALFLAISGLGARPLDYLLFYVLPEITIFLFLARLRMYLEHGPLDYAVSDYLGDAPRRIARTHDSPRLESPFFQYMNFRYHREHHLFPSMPSVHLPEIHRRFTRERLHPDDLSPSYLSSLRRMARLADTPPPPSR
jgi:fatty acid desaturase